MQGISLAHFVEHPHKSWEISFPGYSDEHFAFCNSLASFIATRYMAGSMPFQLADKAINELFAFCYVAADRGMPEFASEVYAAFDQGEYLHGGDTDGLDPEQQYTRPMLAKALANNTRVDG